jgi:phosphopantothenoylcysteine decarboxylase/phosphopantothenate--cysteine ligase
MRIVLGVSGGIAAYKAPDLVRRLQDRGAAVRVILTPNAARFVSSLALSAVSNHGVIIEQWGDPERGGVDHIDLARWGELLLIAPATANIIAKMALGLADDALSTYAVAHRGELMIAPAMNTFMLMHPTVQANLAILRGRGATILEPDSGLLACGDEGAGRMPDPPIIAERAAALFASRDLEGVRVLVTAGPTREPIDPVRFISNRSSGKMGYALAEAARRRGAAVTLVAGPTALVPPANVVVRNVVTAAEMHDAVMGELSTHQVVLKAAAVSDFAPVERAASKIKKAAGVDEMTLTLRKNPDILSEIVAHPSHPFVVAFAAETDSVEENARLKLERKGADLMVANDVSDASIGFDSDSNEVLVLARDGTSSRIARAPKITVANRILDLVVAGLATR